MLMIAKFFLLILVIVYSPFIFSDFDSGSQGQRFLWQSTLCESIFKQHSRLLNNTRIPHKPLVVCFSGVPGMGKTHIAKVLEEKFQGVRISNDEIRTIIKTFSNALTSQWLMQAYMIYFMLSYTAPNKFIILDSSIDRRYLVLLPYLKMKGFPCIVVRLEAPYEQVVEQLTEREQAGQGDFLKFLPQWYADYDTFGQCCPATIVVKNNKKAPLVLDKLFALIRQYLA